MNRLIVIPTLLLYVLAYDAAAGPREDELRAYLAYNQVVARTAGMVRDHHAKTLCRPYRLEILDVTWEDTGRYLGSAVGPNISDMTIQVQQMDPRTEKFSLTCMPVIRYPNFTDRSADIPTDRFFVLVGNEKGRGLRRISLAEFLADMRRYLSKPKSWKGEQDSLLAERDTHVLVSAQACFLPIPQQGIAEFNPVLFNYQSREGDPAVLAILATREGTSVTVIDNKRDAFRAGRTWGQRLFFNQNGERASLTGKRLSDFLDDSKPLPDGQPTPKAAGQAGLNMVLLVQVPLKQKRPMRVEFAEGPPPGLSKSAPRAKAASDVENAVIGHGEVEGPFTEMASLEIKRDERYPVRVTVQFYKATSNGVISPQDIREISEQIERVYQDADYVGSLVVDGVVGRPTEHEGPKFEPPGWWDEFWRRHRENLGLTPEETIRMLRKLHGPKWKPASEDELLEQIRKSRKKGQGRPNNAQSATGAHRFWSRKAHRDKPCWSVAISPEGKQGVSGGFDGQVHLWDLQSGTIRRSFRFPRQAEVATVAFSGDEKQVLAVSRRAELSIWNIADGAKVREISWSKYGVVDVDGAFSDDGQTLAFRGILPGFIPESPAAVADLRTEKVKRLDALLGIPPVISVGCGLSGQTLALGNSERMIHVVAAQTGKLIRELRGKAPVLTVALSRDERSVACSYSPRPSFDSGIPPDIDPGAFDLWDIQTGSKSKTFKAHKGNIRHMLFLPGDKSLVSISDDGTGQLVDLANGRLQVVVPKQDVPPKCAAIDPVGSRVLVGRLDGSISLWRIPGR